MAQPARIIPLWDVLPPGDTDQPAPGERLVAGPDGVSRWHDVAHPDLAIHLPDPALATGTTVVVCPGGGYHILAWDLEGTEVVAWLLSCGIAAALLRYRCPVRSGRPRHEAGVQDLQRAISLLRSRAPELGIDASRIGALGFSAGGNAVAIASAGAMGRLYQAVDVHDDAACRPDFSILAYPAWLSVPGTTTLVAEAVPDAAAPPAFLVHAHDDPHTSEGSIAYYLALRQLGVRAELHVFARGGHGFGLRDGPQPARRWPARCRDWMAGEGWLQIR